MPRRLGPGCLRSWLQDPDGDGIYTFETTALPAGSYEGKVAINESWDVNYGAGRRPERREYRLHRAGRRCEGHFQLQRASHMLTITSKAGPEPDNNVEWDGLRHDSRDSLYRTPGGAVPAGTPVTLRFRTFHNDVTGVKAARLRHQRGGQQLVTMTLAASGRRLLPGRPGERYAVTSGRRP